MQSGGPRISVVVAAHNRSARLVRLLDALRAQTLRPDQFETIVIDDASTDDTPDMLREQERRGDLDLRVIRRERSEGPGAARNEGWRAARAPVVAFTDDDCRPAPVWLEAALSTIGEDGNLVVQGRVTHDPEEEHLLGPFSRSLRAEEADGWYPTANMIYPRALLDRLDGFDAKTFTGPGGEDTDLAWRAMKAGANIRFSDEALVWHCVHVDGPLGRLRRATRWSETMACFRLHPELRRRNLVRGLFWKPSHYHLVRTLVALALPRPLRWSALFFGWRYLTLLYQRSGWEGDGKGGGLPMIPYYALEDVLETVTAARGAVRYRTPVL